MCCCGLRKAACGRGASEGVGGKWRVAVTDGQTKTKQQQRFALPACCLAEATFQASSERTSAELFRSCVYFRCSSATEWKKLIGKKKKTRGKKSVKRSGKLIEGPVFLQFSVPWCPELLVEPARLGGRATPAEKRNNLGCDVLC